MSRLEDKLSNAEMTKILTLYEKHGVEVCFLSERFGRDEWTIRAIIAKMRKKRKNT